MILWPKTKIKAFVREMIQHHRALYFFYRRWECSRQTYTIETEQREYQTRAQQMNIDRDGSPEEVRDRLCQRLTKRNLHIRCKDPKDIHIVYASGLCPWDQVNIVPALRKYSRVSLYLQQPFSGNYQDWLQVRESREQDFVSFIRMLHANDPIDLLLTYYSGDKISPEAIRYFNSLGIVTSSFHLDDRLAFRGYQLNGRWSGPAAVAAAYDLNLTQAPESLVKYRVEGGIPLLWPLAANPELCYPRPVPFEHDVSFVGTAYGNRISLVRYLKRKGIRVAAFGDGWPSGFIPADQFQEYFCKSRINLNFDQIGFTNYQCGKIRDFEIPMCGALMLGTDNPHLSNYFKLGREIFTFTNFKDCEEKIKFLLAQPELCQRVRENARQRALQEHTWEHRVETLLQVVGLLSVQPVERVSV